MDLEQLKLILETVKGITDDATSVAIWYFVLSIGLKFLAQLVCWAGIFGSIYMIATVFKSNNDDEVWLRELRDDLLPDSGGWVDSTDRKKMRRIITELRMKHDGNS